MSQLIQIADFQFVALKDGIDITEQDRKKFASMSFSDGYFRSLTDVQTTLALLDEFDQCPFANDNFMNGLDKEMPRITKTNDFVYIRPAYSVKKDKIPLLLQKAGLKIKRTQSVAYIGRGTNKEEPYILINKDGTPFEMLKGGHANKLNIEIYDDVLALRHDEYEKYLHVKEMIDSGRLAEVDKQDLALWSLIEALFVTKLEALDVVFHEIKHAQNSLIFFDYLFNNPNCKLSAVDIFKQAQDDELSAKLAEAIEAINTYNQSSNKSDLSVFETSYVLQRLLHGKSIEERKRLLSNIPYVVSEVCKDWYKNYAIGYMPQFERITLLELRLIPLKHLVYESDGTSYNDIRKLMFTYNVYDARTGKYINMDLSKYIKAMGISEQDLKMYQDTVVQRQRDTEYRKDKIHNDLIKEARQKYTELVKGTAYHKTLMELQSSGMDYMSALNYIPGVTDAKDKGLGKPVEVHEAPKQQIAEQGTEKESKQIVNIFRNAISKIKEQFLPRQIRKTGSDGRGYE